MDDLGSLLKRTDAVVAGHAAMTGPTLRFGLAGTILLAGVHKFFEPDVWHGYLAPGLASLWPSAVLSLDALMILFGVSEVVFAALLVIDWHTPTVAAVTALSLYATVTNLAIAMAAGQPFGDVLIRDLGLALFATGVAFDAARDG